MTALYEIELAPVARGPLGTLSVRYNVPGGESGREQTALGKSLDMSALIEVAEGATQGEKEREAVVYLMRRLIELAE